VSEAGAHAGSLQQASDLLSTDPEEARRYAEELRRGAPDDPRVILILASAQRRLGNPQMARTLLQPLAARFPQAALTHYELGLVRAELGDTQGAIQALQQALAVNPALSDAWRALGEVRFRAGEEEGALQAFARHERALVREPHLAAAADAMLAGQHAQAESRLRLRLQQVPEDFAALRLLAFAVRRQQRDAEAEALFVLYLQQRPQDDGARFVYAEVLFRRTKGAPALEQLRPLLLRRPELAAYRNLQAAALAQIGESETALQLYEGLLAEYARQPRIWLNYGHALRTVGRIDEAAQAYRRAIALRPALGEAWWSLANLKTRAFTPEDELAMQAALPGAAQQGADPLSALSGEHAEDTIHLHFALGKALEDQGSYAEAFRHYRQGAAARRRQIEYDAAAVEQRVQRYREFFTATLFAQAAAGSDSDAPIFIVGLPRSGSTLVEQILASHPQVEGTLELPDIGYLVEELSRPGDSWPQLLADCSASQLQGLAESYLHSTQVHRRLGRTRFTDKMPNNFAHVGFISLILPRAHIIDVRRHPLAAGFAAFKQHFAQGHTFSYDLAEAGHYYRRYAELMAHWDAVLPGRVHRVIYEDLVDDTEAEIRRLLTYCGLAFEPACLQFHENRRPVRTVSSEQVRQPLYRHAVDRWRHFEPWLGPLKESLGPVLTAWRD
jgi:tetratricopeptide (TPR) repeat protein